MQLRFVQNQKSQRIFSMKIFNIEMCMHSARVCVCAHVHMLCVVCTYTYIQSIASSTHACMCTHACTHTHACVHMHASQSVHTCNFSKLKIFIEKLKFSNFFDFERNQLNPQCFGKLRTHTQNSISLTVMLQNECFFQKS